MPGGSATAHTYRPKLATVFSEGYGFNPFRKDVVAALTVAIVALPLSMAIAVASGVSPERGLYTAIIGGFLVSALGGSRFQVGGPAGAFIVVVAATVAKFGIEGLLLTVLLSGLMLTLIGLLRLGSLIRYTPHAVAVGFTCGIAVTILASQLKDLGGLTLADQAQREQGDTRCRLPDGQKDQNGREPSYFLPIRPLRGAASDISASEHACLIRQRAIILLHENWTSAGFGASMRVGSRGCRERLTRIH